MTRAGDGAVPATVGVRVAGLADGPCRLTIIDLATGAEREDATAVARGLLAGIELTSGDTPLVIGR